MSRSNNPIPPPPPPPGSKRGRPKGSKNKAIADIRALAQSYGADAIDRLNEIMNNNEAPPASQVAAARELLDRGFGRPTQFVANDPDHPPLFDGKMKVDWESMPKEVLKNLLSQAKTPGAARRDPLPSEDEGDGG